jgi:asparagine synthase (glutamine-hydrolysing)
MQHGLEVRVPMLDHEFMEWVSGLPPELKLRGGEGKYLLKKALEPYLPQDVLYRPKMGFAVPLAKWFRGPLREYVRSTLLGPTLDEAGIFNKCYIAELVDRHQAGTGEHSATLWSLLMFEAFVRRVLNGERQGHANPRRAAAPAN